MALLIQDVTSLSQQALEAIEAGSIGEATRLLKQLAQRTRGETLGEAEMLTALLQLMDEWPGGVATAELQRSYARVLRSMLHRLFDRYTDAEARNKARLVTTLHGTTFYAEEVSLNHQQISTLQTILTYLQRPTLTVDDLRESEQLLRQAGIDVTPPMPHFGHFLTHT